jgi:ABC-type phosphate/phosphonate transport system ATPase subunit
VGDLLTGPAQRLGARVELRALGRRYGADAPAVDGVSLDIPAGSFMTLLGPSGSGKTTTLKMIAGFEVPDEGEILVGDRPVVSLAQGQIPKALLQGRVVVPLDQALKQEVAKLKYIASRNPSPESAFHHELSVIADKSVPYDLLLTVLYTAGQNELENYRFVVLKKDEGGQ